MNYSFKKKKSIKLIIRKVLNRKNESEKKKEKKLFILLQHFRIKLAFDEYIHLS